MKIKEIMDYLEEWAPTNLAESWDNVGIQCGDKEATVKKIIIALDPSEDAIDYAIKNNAQLIITHHPLFFSSFKNILYSEPLGKLILKIIDHRLNIIALHTNLDSITDGVSRALLEQLDIMPKGVIQPKQMPNVGFGWWGELKENIEMEVFINQVKERLKLPIIKVVGRKEKIKKVGVCGGSASELLPLAIKLGLDAFVLGEIKYHPARLFEKMPLLILEVGHYESEKWILLKIKEKLDAFFKKYNQNIEVLLFYEESPFKYYVEGGKLCGKYC